MVEEVEWKNKKDILFYFILFYFILFFMCVRVALPI